MWHYKSVVFNLLHNWTIVSLWINQFGNINLFVFYSFVLKSSFYSLMHNEFNIIFWHFLPSTLSAVFLLIVARFGIYIFVLPVKLWRRSITRYYTNSILRSKLLHNSLLREFIWNTLYLVFYHYLREFWRMSYVYTGLSSMTSLHISRLSYFT